MKLYNFIRSPYSRKVRIMLAEKRIPFEYVEYQNRYEDPRYAKMNPYKMVPILELDSGECLYESTVINEYLEEAFPEPPLLPTDPEGRAITRLWEDFGDCHISLALITVLRDKFNFGPTGPTPRDPATVDPAEAQEHLSTLDGDLNRLEERLTGREYVAGPGRGTYTLADVAMAPFILGTASRLDFKIAATRPNLAGWMERIGKRSAVREVLQ